MRLITQGCIGTVALAAAALLAAPAQAATRDLGAVQAGTAPAASFTTLAAAPAADSAPGLAVPALAVPGTEQAVSWQAAGGAERAQAFAPRADALAAGGGTPSTWFDGRLPVPEPNTYALMLAGLGVIGLVARRRRPG